MKLINIFRTAFLLSVVLVVFNSAKERPVHVFMAGDSTMANKPAYKYALDSLSGELVPELFRERGWGMMLQEYFSDNVVIENFAQNGRSTRRFIEEGWWDKIMAKIQKGDYAVIQFAHNDGAKDKPDRYTSPEDYEKNLKKMVSEVRGKGANPIFCTAVVRRKFDNQGKIVDTHGVYPEITRKVASELKVPLIDMQNDTRAWMENEGVAKSARFYHQLPVGAGKLFPNGLKDNTHYNEAGAKVAASYFIAGIEKLDIKPLVKELKKNQKTYVSEVWVSDSGKGKFKNPVLFADYSDPDVCYANGYYYMTASSFNCFPGLPILKSTDMINWSLVNHALYKSEPYDVFAKPQLGCGVWAPAIRYHNGNFYIYYGDPDYGIYMLKARDPEKEWSKPVLVKAGKGLIDPCPLWDEDGRVYLAHAYAGSRYGLKSVLSICELNPEGTKAISEDVMVFDGHNGNETCEGAKIHKYNGYYYVFFPAGGVKDGWQMVMRSKKIYGPYEYRRIMDQGNSPLNGPHQGAWVQTPFGEDWFFHFQEMKPLGRIVHLQPMKWVNDWPVIGIDKDGDGCGEPVTSYTKPKTEAVSGIVTPVESDEFNGNTLGLQWQWYANPKPTWAFFHGDKGFIRLFSDNPTDEQKNLLFTPNLLLQKFPGPDFTVTTKVEFSPAKGSKGERCGLTVMGMDYAALTLENIDGKYMLSHVSCHKAETGASEVNNLSVEVPTNALYMRVKVTDIKKCEFSYSLDGKNFKSFGPVFTAREGQWIGAKFGLFCTRTTWRNDGGWMDVDWLRVTGK